MRPGQIPDWFVDCLVAVGATRPMANRIVNALRYHQHSIESAREVSDEDFLRMRNIGAECLDYWRRIFPERVSDPSH
jgi:hypothetical protein